MTEDQADAAHQESNIPISRLVEPVLTATPDTPVRDVKRQIPEDEPLGAVAVVDNGKPVGLVMSLHLDRELSRQFGVALYYEKPIRRLMDTNPLVVASDASLAETSKLAMNRERDKVYDHVIVTHKGKLSGVVSVQDMLLTLTDLEAQRVVALADFNARLHEEIIMRKKTEEALVRAKTEAEAANRAKSDFVANISHEIRTPMNGVVGFTEMLLDSQLDENQALYADTIRRCGEGLLALINDILDFSKIEAGHLELETLDFNPAKTARDVCGWMRTKADEHAVAVHCRTKDEIPPYVKGDPTRFRQVLLNLVGNAVKFTKSGEIEVIMGVDQASTTQVKLITTVRDTGIGVPEHVLSTIFEPFQQADNSTTRKYGGTGLGLSICKRIVDMMGGDIWAESTVGEGTTFHFTAWLEKSDVTATTPSDHTRRPAQGDPSTGILDSGTSRTGKPISVLLAEDNPVNQKLASMLLTRAGCGVEVVNNGREAVDRYKASPGDYDVIFMDVQMPEMDGLAATQAIRRNGFDRVPIVAMTAHAMKGDREKCLEAGMNDYMTKPIKREVVFEMIEKWVSNRAAL